MPYVMYDPSKCDPSKFHASHPPERLHAVTEGIRMEFKPFKPVNISAPQHRYLMKRGWGDAGLINFDVDDDLIESVLTQRAARLETHYETSGDEIETEPNSEDKKEDGVYDKAIMLTKWSELKAYAQDTMSNPPRSRDKILDSLKEMQASGTDPTVE